MCNCKKTKVEEPQPQLIEIPKVEMIKESIPQTPDELLSQELNNWNGGQQTIGNNGEDIKTTSTDGTSQ